MKRRKMSAAASATATVIALTGKMSELQRQLDAERVQTAFQSSVASAALIKCDELQRKVWELESKLVYANAQNEARRQGLTAAVAMLEKSNDDEESDEHITIYKSHVADFFLTLARIETSR